jgi:hypothetical protein
MLNPTFRLDDFKRRTNIKGKRRGPNMQDVDQALTLYWAEVDNAQPAQGQMLAAYALMKACNTWLKYKKDKFDSNKGKEHFKTRWDEVAKLAKAVFRDYGNSASHAGAFRFEEKKFNAAFSPRRSLKALDEPYAHERAQWEKSKKKGVPANPVSGTSVHETLDRVAAPTSISYNQTLANQFGGMKIFNKQFDHLQLKDWLAIDEVMDQIEKMQKTSVARQVLFLKKADRIQHLVIIRKGKLTKENGDYWDTSSFQEVFVMDEYGNLFIGEGSLGTKDTRLNHSTMLAGKAVLCAGTLNVSQGVLTEFNNNSGHYKPTGEHVYQALVTLQEDGADLLKTQVTIASSATHGWGPLRVDEVIAFKGVLPATHPKAY